MNKLENAFANRSYIHRAMISDKKDNELTISWIKKNMQAVRNKSEFVAKYLEGKIDVLVYQNRKIKRRTKIEMGVD